MKTNKVRPLAENERLFGKKNGLIKKKRPNIYKMMADKYFQLLKWLYELNDKDIEKGLKEGLDKFLSNLYLSRYKNKCAACEYITQKALSSYKKKNGVRFHFEHIVPKTEYIQRKCEELARQGKLQVKYIETLLRKYFHCAYVTEEEDKRLLKDKMPTDWNGKDIFARYKKAGIKLIENPFYGEKGD